MIRFSVCNLGGRSNVGALGSLPQLDTYVSVSGVITFDFGMKRISEDLAGKRLQLLPVISTAYLED